MRRCERGRCGRRRRHAHRPCEQLHVRRSSVDCVCRASRYGPPARRRARIDIGRCSACRRVRARPRRRCRSSRTFAQSTLCDAQVGPSSSRRAHAAKRVRSGSVREARRDGNADRDVASRDTAIKKCLEKRCFVTTRRDAHYFDAAGHYRRRCPSTPTSPGRRAAGVEKKSPKLLTHQKTVIRFRPSSETCESEWQIKTRQRAPQNGPPPGLRNRWTQDSFPSRKRMQHSDAARSAAGGPGFFVRAACVHNRQVLSISAGASASRRCFRRIGSRMRRPVAGLFPRRCLELGITPIDH